MKSLPALGLFRRREIWLPTRRGLLVFLLLLASAAATLLFGLYPFLAEQTPRGAGAMVVEGWMDDEVLAQVVHEFRTRHYSPLYATGQPIEQKSPYRDYGTYANYGASRLHDLGLPETIAVPSAPIQRDRTFSSALALRDWMRAHGGVPRELTVVTFGPHARRSHLLFQRAFGGEAAVGVISLAPGDYDTARWWRTSSGFRDVIGESIAWLYARLLFRPGAE